MSGPKFQQKGGPNNGGSEFADFEG